LGKHLRDYGIHKPPMDKVFKWKVGNLFKKKRTKVSDDEFILKVHPLTKEALQREDDFILWLGHASFYIQLDGIKILTDPVMEVPLTPRLVPLPIKLEELEPDIILVSHGHFDHLDLKALDALKVYDKKTKIIMPTDLSSYLKKEANTTELDWFEEYDAESLSITALPASHWHRRGVFDFNRALWCSFSIIYKEKTIFFAGDTAFDSHFKEIQKYLPKIDVALMPIGAYLPREVMQTNHIDPQEALQATEVLDAKTMIPYHYGTFKLSDEPIGEPHSWITRLSKTSKMKINILEVGNICSL